ncbi:MAG: hypothetical protein U1F63_00605 [Chitinivorax sp.]
MSEQNQNQTAKPDDGGPLITEEWQLEMIREGIADIEAGRTIPHEEVVAMVNRLVARDAA